VTCYIVWQTSFCRLVGVSKSRPLISIRTPRATAVCQERAKIKRRKEAEVVAAAEAARLEKLAELSSLKAEHGGFVILYYLCFSSICFDRVCVHPQTTNVCGNGSGETRTVVESTRGLISDLRIRVRQFATNNLQTFFLHFTTNYRIQTCMCMIPSVIGPLNTHLNFPLLY
jgi:hypothetical protein